MSRTLRLSTAMLVLSLAGSTEGLAPDALGPEALSLGDVAGTYGLYRYGGTPVPRQYTADNGCTVRIEGGVLVLASSGSFLLQIWRQQQCPGQTAPQYPDVSLSGDFVLAGGGLSLHPVRDSTPAPTLTARLQGTHIILPVPHVPGLAPDTVGVEFAAGSWGDRVRREVEDGEGPIVIIIRPP